jgi:hypothetical protein
MANLLLHESSPYLLQHAHNPVNWRAWNDETLSLAKSQNKLMLISIGYSACHWCHVMEKQCFENEDAARIMNKYFICVKVDREERPDIDAVYMQALQLMSGQGGWPLNCFTLPDGRPIYGGTYFPLEKWMAVLENLQQLFETNLQAMEEYAQRLLKGIQQTQIYNAPKVVEEDLNLVLKNATSQWKKHFDLIDGGTQRVPKFPMPCNYLFLLNYGYFKNDSDIISHVITTLNKMSMGGIFDQLAGGFARYSTDGIWKVPHFEKMLYDNAQLVSLYAKAYQTNQDPNYKFVVEKTLEFVLNELKGPNDEFFSALDADSEGEEGKFYVWKKEELIQILGSKFEHFSNYYNINETGYWEHGNYILMRTQLDHEFCNQHQIKIEDLIELKANWAHLLLPYRKKRIAPGLDDKSLTSWHALMVKAFVDAYIALDNPQYLMQASLSAQFILDKQVYNEKYLYHSYKSGHSSINGFLEDYALTAACFIQLYKATGNETWLNYAKVFCQNAMENFFDEQDGLFYFNSKNDSPLIARQKEVQDNVIPSSNSVIANVLYQIGIYFELDEYVQISKKMASHFLKEVEQYGSAYGNWASLLLRFEMPVIQVAIPSKDYQNDVLKIQTSIHTNYYPYCVQQNSNLPFVADKLNSASYYLCTNNVCGLPLNNRNELITALTAL